METAWQDPEEKLTAYTSRVAHRIEGFIGKQATIERAQQYKLRRHFVKGGYFQVGSVTRLRPSI